MNQASNTSGTTTIYTTMTCLDEATNCSSSSIGEGSMSSNGGEIDEHDTNLTTPSQSSHGSSAFIEIVAPTAEGSSNTEEHLIYDYKRRAFVHYKHLSNATCEEIVIEFCRIHHILPTTRLLFSLRSYDSQNEWVVPSQQLRAGVRYCFRIRFKVAQLDTQLHSLDSNAYEYLYNQMRSDVEQEEIPEIRYPAKKDNVVGLGVVNMYIDFLGHLHTADHIKSNYKRYLPRRLIKAHGWFVKPKICHKFDQFCSKNIESAHVTHVKWTFVREVHKLAQSYLMETYEADVDYIPPTQELSPTNALTIASDTSPYNNGTNGRTAVYVKLDLHNSQEPGLKIAKKENELKWILLTKFENIYALFPENQKCVRIESIDFRESYRMEFKNKVILESFITYLAGYIRLITKWRFDLFANYETPSLRELKELRCHGPVGGAFSFGKIRAKHNDAGSYILRQCEKEYDIYFIDINTKFNKTETFKIVKDRINSKWILHYNNSCETFNDLIHLANSISTESHVKLLIRPSDYDKPPLLLICSQKILQMKKADTELSESELQHRRVQIFDPKKDLRWYQKSDYLCDNGKMLKMRADWIQKSNVKDVDVTLKILNYDEDFQQFMVLANKWSQIYSPQFIKLYGITLSSKYAMIMEYAEHGPLREFLMRFKGKVINDKRKMLCLLDVVHCLKRGIVYLKEHNIIHGFLRCQNLYVTKFLPEANLLEVKIADPGFPRAYNKEDLPWIPFEYFNNLNAAKEDQSTDHWAFATTIWEIFAFGETICNKSEETLRTNINQYGGILQKPKHCPEEMYEVMMNGWNVYESDKRFTINMIDSCLTICKETFSKPYERIESNEFEDDNDQSDTPARFNMIEHAFNGFRITNGHNSVSDSNSTTSDQAPLLRHQQKHYDMHNRNFFVDKEWALELTNGKLICKENIGEGHYGSVYLGQLFYNKPEPKTEQVAIKVLKTMRGNQLNDFMREIRIMQKLDHPNVVKIKEWVDEPSCIIMEYIAQGSFSCYLATNKDLRNEMLLNFALDIAKGMDYLSSCDIIHRDLAARNILVDRDCVKISDFGLAQKADKDGYYIARSQREIPIKWYSPESIRNQKFSFQSDVWSYGVTLFETFSRGETPNLDPDKELSKEDFLNQLERGVRLLKPEQCPQIIYDELMRPCWREDPKMRPDFKGLTNIIQSIKDRKELIL